MQRSRISWSAIIQEVVDARVWIGVHFRTSDEVGVALGRRVADDIFTRLEHVHG